MRHGSLFSGIGGFDLAAQWMGWDNVFHCEWNPFGQKILHHYWPNAIQYHDITKTDFSVHRGTIDILTGGFPCQPYSMAGKRLGKEDERHLWPHMLRAIREIRPRWVVGENVLGLVNWNGGLVFDEVQADLEAEGYEVQPYVLPAVAVDAPHRRDRVWFVAYSSAIIAGQKVGRGDEKKTQHGTARHGCKEIITHTSSNGYTDRREETGGQIGCSKQRGMQQSSGMGSEWDVTDSKSESGQRVRLEQREFSESEQREFGGRSRKVGGKWDAADSDLRPTRTPGEGGGTQSGWGENDDEQNQWGGKAEQHTGRVDVSRHAPDSMLPRGRKDNGRGESKFFDENGEIGNWETFPTQSPICSGDDGIPARLDGITFSKWRNESIKGYGNAVVPQVVHQIFKAIAIFESQSHTHGSTSP
jgi:DNA (cytosine-5)-methyltransferase 1